VSGETIQEGAERETREELGLELSLDGILPSLCLRFDEGINVIYLVQKDVDPAGLHLQAEEVHQVKWAGREEILKMIDEGTFVAYNKDFIDLLFHFHSNNDIFIAEDPTE
ncbi:MAG: NUDIX domain-containing protein, partial [Solobacterium sp.]|nr:NUDIX domain-containing protein [Solobacterium sp.]